MCFLRQIAALGSIRFLVPFVNSQVWNRRGGVLESTMGVLKTSSLKVGFIINLGIKIVCWEKFIFLEIRQIPMQAIAYIILGADKTFSRFTPANVDETFWNFIPSSHGENGPWRREQDIELMQCFDIITLSLPVDHYIVLIYF